MAETTGAWDHAAARVLKCIARAVAAREQAEPAALFAAIVEGLPCSAVLTPLWQKPLPMLLRRRLWFCAPEAFLMSWMSELGPVSCGRLAFSAWQHLCTMLSFCLVPSFPVQSRLVQFQTHTPLPGGA